MGDKSIASRIIWKIIKILLGSTFADLILLRGYFFRFEVFFKEPGIS